MKSEWLTGVEVGDALQAILSTPLYSQSMWAQFYNDDTWILSMPVLEPGDHIIVIDVINDDREPGDIRVFAALVITHLGVGCVLLLNQHFKML